MSDAPPAVDLDALRHETTAVYPWKLGSAVRSHGEYVAGGLSPEEQALRIYRLHLIRAMKSHPRADWGTEDVAGHANFWLLYHILCRNDASPKDESKGFQEVWCFVMSRAVMAAHPEHFKGSVLKTAELLRSYMHDGIPDAECAVMAYTHGQHPDTMHATLCDPMFWNCMEHVPPQTLKAFAERTYIGPRAYRMQSVVMPTNLRQLVQADSLPRTGFDATVRAVHSTVFEADTDLQTHVGRMLSTTAMVQQ